MKHKGVQRWRYLIFDDPVTHKNNHNLHSTNTKSKIFRYSIKIDHLCTVALMRMHNIPIEQHIYDLLCNRFIDLKS